MSSHSVAQTDTLISCDDIQVILNLCSLCWEFAREKCQGLLSKPNYLSFQHKCFLWLLRYFDPYSIVIASFSNSLKNWLFYEKQATHQATSEEQALNSALLFNHRKMLFFPTSWDCHFRGFCLTSFWHAIGSLQCGSSSSQRILFADLRHLCVFSASEDNPLLSACCLPWCGLKLVVIHYH